MCIRDRINAERSKQRVTLQPCGSAVRRYVDGEGNPLSGQGIALHMVVTPGVSRFDLDAMRKGAVEADHDFAANIDRLNHWKNRSDDDGRLVLSALIPGTTYLYPSGKKNKLNEFVAKSGEVHDLGEVVIDEDDATAKTMSPPTASLVAAKAAVEKTKGLVTKFVSNEVSSEKYAIAGTVVDLSLIHI